MSTNGTPTTSELIEGSKPKAAAPAASSSGFTDDEINAFAKGMLQFLRSDFVPELLEKHIEPLLKSRTRRLEERVRELEQRPLLELAGLWNAKTEYHPGMVTVWNGSSWAAKTLHSHGEPGKSPDWQLLCMRGRDGKDSR